MVRPVFRIRARSAALALVVALGGCGAKTGLLLPDATVDADVEDAFQRFEACVDGRFSLVRREAQLVFVIDRSGSMADSLNRGGPSRWSAMYDVLSETLPAFEHAMRMGVLLFPRVPVSAALASAQSCDQLPGTGVDVAPLRDNAGTVLTAIRQFGPSGATPTASAVRRAARFTAATGSRELARYLVLATDGAPNCNLTLNPSTCTCAYGGTNCANAGLGARYCLDDDATVVAIDEARRGGIATYVIGIDGDLNERYLRVLDRMALAGGRALPTAPRYYSIQDRAQLAVAFETIQRTVTRCAYVTPSRPDDPDRITVTRGGATIPRDPTRREGWDWTDRDYGELTLFGAACDEAPTSATIEATVACGR